MSTHVLGVDLGGSNVRAVLADASGRIVADAGAPTAQDDARAVVAQIAHLCRDVATSGSIPLSRIAAAGLGVPGAVHAERRELRLAPNLPSFVELDLAGVLGEELGVPVVLDNDVNVATLAEQRQGLGAGLADFAFIAVGTGIGMGIVASGRLQRGATGAAGEIAYLPLGRDPFEPGHQVHGSLEEAAGGVGVARRYAELSGDAISALDVYERAATGDPHARAVLDEQARAIALAVVSAQSMLDPALVVFGGGIGSRADLIARVRTYVGRLTGLHLAIEASRLGERAGLIGAAELARAHADGRLTEVLPR
jgi:predicted NBD/HSP70 family sugar kinase